MSELTWGDTVQVIAEADVSLRPGSLAEVVGIREITTAMQARDFDSEIGEKVFLIEFGDGYSAEVLSKWIEKQTLPEH
ncbi:MAG: hypothetical protein AAGD01_17160 [Acidobacteriota bacterium]